MMMGGGRRLRRFFVVLMVDKLVFLFLVVELNVRWISSIRETESGLDKLGVGSQVIGRDQVLLQHRVLIQLKGSRLTIVMVKMFVMVIVLCFAINNNGFPVCCLSCKMHISNTYYSIQFNRISLNYLANMSQNGPKIFLRLFWVSYKKYEKG